MRRAILAAGVLVAMAFAPALAQADLYNPTTAEYVPTEYYYPAPAPPFPDPPPVIYPTLVTPPSTPSAPSGSGSSPVDPTRTPKQVSVLGYTRSPKVSKEANRQMAALFAKRLGTANFDQQRFVAEADKGTFRAAFASIVKPLGWSSTDYADALAAYTISSYQIANGIAQLTADGRAGAQVVADGLRAKLLKSAAMKRQSSRKKQIATERLNTITIVQIVQYANGDAAARAAQSASTRQAGLRTFKGDLTRVVLGDHGFVARPPGT